MYKTLNWTNENVVYTINLDSLVDHEDHCQMCDGGFVRNHSIYSTSIGMSGLFVKTVDIDKMFMVVNKLYIGTYYTSVCM